MTDGPVADATGPSSSLWRHREFRLFWVGDAVSQVGSQLTGLAIPVLAVSTLHASEFDMGLLGASEQLAFLLIGLPAGALVDRMRKQRVMVVTDLIRALCLVLLPLAIWLGGAAMWQLYAIALTVGACTVFFDVAWQSYPPLLLDADRLAPANSRLQATESVAFVVTPALGGQLLRAIGAPVVILVDAASFLASAAFVGRIRDREERRSQDPEQVTRLRHDIAEGMRFLLRQKLLMRITTCTGISNFASSMASALYVLYVLRDLDLSTADLGVVFSIGAVGGLLGALVAAPLSRWIGEGRLIPLAILPSVPAVALTPLASHLPGPTLAWLALGGAGMAFAGVTYNITHISYRQRLCPPRLLARMNASIRFLVFGAIPLGSVTGGALGATIGIVPTLWVATALTGVSVLPVLVSPLIRMREIPTEPTSGV